MNEELLFGFIVVIFLLFGIIISAILNLDGFSFMFGFLFGFFSLLFATLIYGELWLQE